MLEGDRRGVRGPPDWAGGIAGTVEDISDTPQAPGPDDAMPGRGAERLPGKSVDVKPID